MSSKNVSVFHAQAMEKLFESIGEKYYKDYVSKPAWYLTKSWTQQQQDLFVEWYVNESVKVLKVPKKMAEREACYFVTNYGWKVNDGVKAKQ